MLSEPRVDPEFMHLVNQAAEVVAEHLAQHLAKEVQEALADPANPEEYADLLFLVLDAFRRAGFTYRDLIREVGAKLIKNKAREWPKPTSDEPVEHVRSEAINPQNHNG